MERDYIKEIEYREQLMDKAINKTITKEDRFWLVTNPVYNLRWGELTYNTVIENIKPKTKYILKVKIESVNYDKEILPVIAVPGFGEKGYILVDEPVYNLYGKLNPTGKVKMLAIDYTEDNREITVEFFSKFGFMKVFYHCDYYDSKTRLHNSESSSSGNPLFAMKRQVINDHSVRYFCKTPLNESFTTDPFDALIFTVEWTPKNLK